MQKVQELPTTVTANQIGCPVAATSPVFSDVELKQKVQGWINKQGKHWPEELTVDAVFNNLKRVHLPYWVVSGQGSAQWSASIGVDHQVTKTCGTCGGRGRFTPLWSTDERRCDNCAGSGKALGTETFWSSQAGFVEGRSNGVVRENFEPSRVKLQCGERDFKIDSQWINDDQKHMYLMIAPNTVTNNDGLATAREVVKNKLKVNAHNIASDMGYVRNLQLANVQLNNLSAEFWLYPLYLGQYNYEEEVLPVQIDAITGNIWADVPKSVKSARLKDILKVIAIIVLVFAIGYGIWWLQMVYF